MSQPSPSNMTPGGTPGGTPSGATPNGVSRLKIRKPQKPADPFMHRKPPRRHREQSPESSGRRGKPLHKNDEYMRAQDGAVVNSALVSVNAAIPIVDSSSGIITSGFTTAAPGNFRDYPVVITKRQIKAKIRCHVARFYGKQNINPINQSEWTRPVRLHRRDPRATPQGGKNEEPDAKDVQIEEERGKQQQLREVRQAERAAEMSEIAPSMTGQQPKKFVKDHKKFVEVRRKDETEAKRVASQLSYEEALPWHFEDDENRQVWVGTYEAALSEAYAQFTMKGDKVYLAPLEKWYKFTQQRIFKSQEELEAHEAKRNNTNPKFLRAWAEREEVVKTEKRLQEAASKLWQVGGKRTANFNSVGKGAKPDREDADELDFDEDIADDDEDPVYEGDVEETKETQKRIKKDQLKANIFNMKDEGSYDEEEAAEELEKILRKQLGKSTNKLLIKQENNRLYATDSDESDADEVSQSLFVYVSPVLLANHLSEQDPNAKKVTTEAEKQKIASGESSKGTNTPSDRKEKYRKLRSQDQSEASGNESSRRKPKKNGISSNLVSGRNTPNGSTPRAVSPTGSSGGPKPLINRSGSTRPNDLKRPRVGGAGSGSDGDGAGSGGDMSDASRKRIKLIISKPGSRNVSPGGSRAASPIRDSVAQASKSGSFFIPQNFTERTNCFAASRPPTIEQIKASIPEGGMSMKDFTTQWRPFVNGNKEKMMKMMKGAITMEKRAGGSSWVFAIP